MNSTMTVNMNKLKELFTSKEQVDKTKGFQILMSTNRFMNTMEFNIQKTIKYYGLPELIITESDKADYEADLRVSFLIGASEGIKMFDFKTAAALRQSDSWETTIMAYLTGFAKHEMIYGERGVLSYMKKQYPDCTEYYLKTLVSLHKKGLALTMPISHMNPDILVSVIGSEKTAENLQIIFTEREEIGCPVNMINYSESFENEKVDFLNDLLKKARLNNFSIEEIAAIKSWLEDEQKIDIKIVHKFKKFAKQELA